MGMTSFQERIARVYGSTAAPSTSRQIYEAIHQNDEKDLSLFLTESEKQQINDIFHKTGVPIQVIVDFFAKTGRYCGERKKSFINAVQNAQRKHGQDLSTYIEISDITDKGHLKNIGNILQRRTDSRRT